jgi:hypothetical protein
MGTLVFAILPGRSRAYWRREVAKEHRLRLDTRGKMPSE